LPGCVVAVLKHVTGRHGCDGPVTELALAQLLLCLHPVSHFNQEPDHARGTAIRLPLGHTAAVKHPAPAAVFVSEPVFRLVETLPACDHVVDGRLDAHPVLRVNTRIPEAPGAIGGLRIDTQNPIVRLSVCGLSGSEVPIPHSTAGAFERCLQPALTADVFELRLLALLDVHAHADHPQRSTVGVPFNYPAALKQPPPPALLVTNAVLRIVVVGVPGN